MDASNAKNIAFKRLGNYYVHKKELGRSIENGGRHGNQEVGMAIAEIACGTARFITLPNAKGI